MTPNPSPYIRRSLSADEYLHAVSDSARGLLGKPAFAWGLAFAAGLVLGRWCQRECGCVLPGRGSRRRGGWLFLAALMLVLGMGVSGFAETSGETTVSKWKDGRKAVYLISFDDSAPSQLVNVIPELNRRKIVGNFYVVPGGGPWKGHEKQWIEAAKSPYIQLENHTFTHKGVKSAEELGPELAKCNEVLYGIYKDRKQPFLIGWGKPGGVPWEVSKEEQAAALKANNLVDRPPFWGSPMHYKTQEELVASVDKAIAKGEMGHDDMHGVGGDWLVTPTEWFTALLDKLEAEKEQLWVPDIVSYTKYLTERQSAEVKVVKAEANAIEISLTSKADPALYDYPLTLTTKVPAGWTAAIVTQGAAKAEVPVKNGAVMYDAVPGAGDVRVARR